MERAPGQADADGNQVAAGNPGPGTRYRVLTQTLIAALHEVDTRTGKERIYLLVDKLIERAIVDGDMEAIKYIFDRVDGRLPCAVRFRAQLRQHEASEDAIFTIGP